MLDVALRLLAVGGADAVSVNLVAKEAGVTWGTVQYQFGDADGLWAATLEHILATAGPVVWAVPTTASPADRIRELIDLGWAALHSTYYTARTALQSGLSRTHAELARGYPQTSKMLGLIDETWGAQINTFLADLPADPAAIQKVCAFLPTALKGMRSEYAFGSRFDVDEALAGLCEALTGYLTTTT